MSVRIIEGPDAAVLFCSTSEWAFGPVFHEKDDRDSGTRAQMFLDWLVLNGETESGMRYNDAREFTDRELEQKYSLWLRQEEFQWAKIQREEK